VTQLILGPHEGGLTVDQLRVAWELERDRVMDWALNGPDPRGKRAWAYWEFDLQEPQPEDVWHDGPVRLAELRLLTPRELATFQEEANEARLRIGTEAERHYWPKGTGSVCRDAVRLWQAIEAVR
jgi:hypothetical protein